MSDSIDRVGARPGIKSKIAESFRGLVFLTSLVSACDSSDSHPSNNQGSTSDEYGSTTLVHDETKNDGSSGVTTGMGETTGGDQSSSTATGEGSGEGGTSGLTTSSNGDIPSSLIFSDDLPVGVPNGFDVYGAVGTPESTYQIFYTNSCDTFLAEKECGEYIPYSEDWTCNVATIDMNQELSRDCIITVFPINNDLDRGPEEDKVFKVTN